jgi:hypothetical protein
VAIYQACPKRFLADHHVDNRGVFGPVLLACRRSIHVLDQILCGGTMAVSFSNLQLACEFVSSGGTGVRVMRRDIGRALGATSGQIDSFGRDRVQTANAAESFRNR